MRSRYYTSEYHKLSYVLYMSVVMDCVTVRVLNLSSVLSINGCNFHTDFDLLSFFLFIRCVGMGGLCGALRLQFYMLFSDLVTS